ncbi:hypothetical protein CYMTET_24155 [Cymbomonas tetramitiformis]|uniref:CREG-like beta-barrel domain-containing protein n=1 Tax=Cymbomonas tetramitiformis TaxID=36881 RepID=A0AAE0L0I1_9CHLO|nr:hypothetical protein CYMTET_24155 [Cymbomonas tetramitiformis]
MTTYDISLGSANKRGVSAAAKKNSKGDMDQGEPPLVEMVQEDSSLPPLESTYKEMKVPQLNISSTGLSRTPISGGVQSATRFHELPPPSVAVRNLVEQAKYCQLSTTMSSMHHRRAGYPFGSLVDFAMDSTGRPIFSFSPLAIHTRNIMADPRSSMVVQMPGWSGLSNARVTIMGDIYPLPEEAQALAKEIFERKHTRATHSHQWGSATFFRMGYISDIYFVGGFGTVQFVDVQKYLTTPPDAIVKTTTAQSPEIVITELNKRFEGKLKHVLSIENGIDIDDCLIVSIDKLGMDVRVRAGPSIAIQRMHFKEDVDTLHDALNEVQQMTMYTC